MSQPNPNNQPTPSTNSFRDRRDLSRVATPPGVERRQFANSHDDLSPRARELAVAIDEYKIQNRRRFVTFEEVLTVLESLGYSKSEPTG